MMPSDHNGIRKIFRSNGGEMGMTPPEKHEEARALFWQTHIPELMKHGISRGRQRNPGGW